MKAMNKIKYAILALAAVVAASCQREQFNPNEQLSLSRCLQPMNLNARVSAALGDVVTFSWDVTKDAEVYVLTVLTADGNTYLTEELGPSAVPCQKKLEADKTYTFSVQAKAEGKGDSKLAEYGKTFKTFAVKDNLFLKVTDRTAESVTLAWSKDVADYYEVSRIDLYYPGSDEVVISHELTAGEIEAAAATVDGLHPGTEYVFMLMYLSASRGQVDAWTTPDTTGFTEVNSLEGLQNAIKTAGAQILLKMEGSPYDLEAVDISNPFAIIGEESADGTKPVIQGEFHIADNWASDGVHNLYFEGVEFNGGPTATSPSGFVIRDNLSSYYQPYFGNFADIDLYKGMETNNWIQAVFGNTGSTFSTDFSVSGSGDSVNWTLGYAHMGDEAIMVGSTYDRDNLNFKANFKTSEKTSIDANVRYSRVNVRGAGANGINDTGTTSGNGRLKHAVSYSPIPIASTIQGLDEEQDYGDNAPPLLSVADKQSGHPVHLWPLWKGRRHQAQLFPGLLHRGHHGLYLRPQHRLLPELHHPQQERQLCHGGLHPGGAALRLCFQGLQAYCCGRGYQVLSGPSLGRFCQDGLHQL